MTRISYNSNTVSRSIHNMHIPSHPAIRFFLLTFSTGLIVLLIGGLIFLTLPKRTGTTNTKQSSTELSGDDLSRVTVHVHGVITSLGDHVFTIRTEGVADKEQPASVVVHYTDGTLESIDTAASPDPVTAKTPESVEIDASALHIGDTVDVTTESIKKDSTDIDAVQVLQIL